MLSPGVILNLVQDPFLTIDGGLFGKMDPEPKASEAKQVQDDGVGGREVCVEGLAANPCHAATSVRLPSLAASSRRRSSALMRLADVSFSPRRSVT